MTKFEFNLDGTKLNIEFQSKDSSSKMWITCMYIDGVEEVLIGAFDLALYLGPNNPYYNFSIGYLYKFRKNTIYQFSNYELHFKIEINSVEEIEIGLTSFVIQFQEPAQNCEFINEALEIVDVEFKKGGMVTPCKSVDEKWAFEDYGYKSFIDRLRQSKYIWIDCIAAGLVLIAIGVILLILCCVKLRKRHDVQSRK
ncbi:hypothetical protein RF11_04192 [Thelohanellus kitauei]|uniref:Uncharacterized protein n=1 Tax=Thelohanellus kitauei TaxID=669202 RepID=A0A0C2NM81_THEKT|nr:hypothetical protein RF11_04192 [Thelohanellus kitauei]